MYCAVYIFSRSTHLCNNLSFYEDSRKAKVRGTYFVYVMTTVQLGALLGFLLKLSESKNKSSSDGKRYNKPRSPLLWKIKKGNSSVVLTATGNLEIQSKINILYVYFYTENHFLKKKRPNPRANYRTFKYNCSVPSAKVTWKISNSLFRGHCVNILTHS